MHCISTWAAALALNMYAQQQHSQRRQDLGLCCMAGTSVAEVDSVLSTLEVQQLLGEEACQLASLPDAPTDSLMPGAPPEEGDIFGYPGGAGGSLEFVFR